MLARRKANKAFVCFESPTVVRGLLADQTCLFREGNPRKRLLKLELLLQLRLQCTATGKHQHFFAFTHPQQNMHLYLCLWCCHFGFTTAAAAKQEQGALPLN